MRSPFRTAMALVSAAWIAWGCSPGGVEPPAEAPAETAAAAPAFDPSLSDPRAIEIAREVYAAMGGEEGFLRAAQITFRFVVEREGEVVSDYQHAWDRRTGRYRLQGVQKDGDRFVAFFNVQDFDRNQPRGDVFVTGRRLDDWESPAQMQQMYGRFINDTYWLLMPAKLMDPGVVLKYDGERQDPSGRVHDVLLVSFQPGTGLTSEDRYWAYVDRETRLMDRWEYVLTGEPPDATPTAATWEEWEPHGPIVLSTRKEFPGRPYRILFADLEVSETVDDSLFIPPAPGASPLASSPGGSTGRP